MGSSLPRTGGPDPALKHVGTGYPRKYEMVKLAVRPLRAAPPQAVLATVRIETAPGVQWQADWSSTGDGVTSRANRLQLFTMVSSYSRRLYAELTLDPMLPTRLACHENAFDWFSGLPTEILDDNPKTIVVSGSSGHPQRVESPILGLSPLLRSPAAALPTLSSPHQRTESRAWWPPGVMP